MRSFSDNASIGVNGGALPLCARLATLQAREDTWHVTCPHCFRFTLDPYLLDLFESARQRTDVQLLGLLPRLSDAARRTASEGGQLKFTGENWRAAVRSVASPDK